MPNDSAVKHYILATAGHVDHGKTALIHALTGTDTDRLPEEKSRGITIDLGFAHLALPGLSIGVIDVPGHEDFVRNMIAGVGAIDVALLVVAVDDGWMPQTEEHLQILTYLGVTRGVVALTKSDLGLVDSQTTKIRQHLQNSPFAGAPIVPTSVRSGTGIDEIKTVLANEFAQLPPARDYGMPRLFIDRVFTIHGSGTVVTGSLSGGSFVRGGNILLQSQNLSARIRGLQSHNQALEIASPRRRLALNLSDLTPAQITRGSTVCAANNAAQVSSVIDVLLNRSSRLPSGTRSIGNGATLDLHFGSARIAARAQLLDRRELLPDENAIARLRLAEPVCGLIGDRFILRDSSERRTVAGGVVLCATAEKTKFRSPKQRILLSQRALAPNDLRTLLRTQVESDGFRTRHDLLPNAPFSQEELATALKELRSSGDVFCDEKIVASAIWWESLRKRATRLIDAEHAAHPELPGLELSRLREELEIANADLFAALMHAVTEHDYQRKGNVIRRLNFRPTLPLHLQAVGERIRLAVGAHPFDPPARRELASDSAAAQALRFLVETGELVAVSDELVMRADAVTEIKGRIEKQLGASKKATVSELRQAIGSTRRVIVPLLEYFDRIGLTKRVGDRRMLR